MNCKVKILFPAAILAGLLISSSMPLSAQVPLKISISGTALAQGATNDTGSITTGKAPIKSDVTTGSVLKQLALDEKAAGLWPTNDFPAGAILAYVYGSGFCVMDRNYNTLLIVTNILSLRTNGQISVSSEYYIDGSAGVQFEPFTQTNIQLSAFAYDATSAGGLTKYTVTGMTTATARNTAPNMAGNSVQTASFNLPNGCGEGVNAAGVNVILTGFTVSGSGKVTTKSYGPPLGGFSLGTPPPPPLNLPPP